MTPIVEEQVQKNLDDLNKQRWYHGVWFLPFRDEHGRIYGDLMATAYCTGPDSPHNSNWTLEYRLRTYEPGQQSKDPFKVLDKDSQGLSSGQRVVPRKGAPFPGKDQFIANAKKFICKIENDVGGKADFVDLQCWDTDPKMFFEMLSRPWCYAKKLSEEEMRTYLARFTEGDAPCPDSD